MKYFMMLLCVALCACNLTASEGMSGLGGGPPVVDNRPTLHMPFATGTTWRCTQGASGTYSHQYTSTLYDVDFDTPNGGTPTELYAPVSGTAYVHNDGTGFGIHINIDHGDGQYTSLGHLSQAFVASGAWVEAGELVGLDGCTGNCTGDHVHVGVHAGDATRPAGEGRSVPFNVFAMDVSMSQQPVAHNTSEMVCGLTEGHFYESQLLVWSDSQEEMPDPPEQGDDDDVTEEPDDDDATPPDDDPVEPEGVIELCWQPTGLVNPHDAELWVWNGGWQAVDSAFGSVVQLCGTIEADPGDVLLVNGEFEAANVLSNPWWMCSNWGEALGMVVHGDFYINGLAVSATDVDNGVNGCNVRLIVP